MSIDRPDQTWWQATDGRWYPPAPMAPPPPAPSRVWPWRVRLAVISVLVGCGGLALYNSGEGDQALTRVASVCELRDAFGDRQTAADWAKCAEEDRAGEGKKLGGLILMGAGAAGLLGVIVSGGGRTP